jgi:hypothetical protein
MKRTSFRYLWPLLLLLTWGRTAAAQSGAAVLRPEPAALTLAAGETQTVAIVIESAAEVYGIDVRASFDPALVEIVDANPGREGVQMTPGDFPQPDFVALNAADNAAGALRYAVTQVNPTPPASGSGTVFTIQVRGRAAGTSLLRIDLVEMANRSGELLAVTTSDGTITITGTAAAQPTGIALTLPAEEQPPAPPAAATASAATATANAATTNPPADNAPLPTTAAPPATSEATTSQPAPTAAPGETVNPAAPSEGNTAAPQSSSADTNQPPADAPTAAAPQTDDPSATSPAPGTAEETVSEAGSGQVMTDAPAAVVGAGSDPAAPPQTASSTSNRAPWLIGGVVVVIIGAFALLALRGRGQAGR